MTPRRHFFDWSSPLAPQAARWLLAQALSAPCPDLSDWAVIVPTAEAGRRLRAGLLREVPAGLLPPAALTPVQFLDACALPNAALPIATREERLLAWCSVLLREDPADSPALFPEPPARQDFTWARDIARLFLQTQTLLIENGWTLKRAVQQTGLLPDPERWNDLVRLEDAYAACLAKAGRADPMRLWLELLREPRLPENVRHVALIGTPDPVPVLLRLLEHASLPGMCPVLIHAPASETEAFDAWGRPIPDAWETRPILGADANLHLSLSEEAQARASASAVAAHPSTQAVVLGLGREALAPLLDAELRGAGIPSYDPSGSPALRHPLWAFLDSLQRLLARGGFADLLAWLRHPATSRWLLLRLPAQSPSERLAILDRFGQDHLPQSWRDLTHLSARRQADRAALDALSGVLSPLLEELSGPAWIPALRTLLAEAHLPSGEQRHCEEAVRSWLAAQETFGLPGSPLRPADRLALFVEELALLRLPEERPEHAVELKGWLELGWEERPHLLLTGFQEGGIPRPPAQDLFVTASLRKQLGLRTADQRFACDAYQLKALSEQRRANGRIDLLLSRFSPDGEPLLPSRLLFLCPDEALADRVRRIFEIPASEERLAAPTLAFPLRPLPAEPPRKAISVTHFRDYLESPFFYYLHRLAKWEALDPDKQEMDPLDYGTLAHDVLERFGKDPGMSACADPDGLARYLSEHLDAAARRTFGQLPPLSVEIQLHSLHNRLAAFARHQAAQAAEGWRIEAVEQPFELELEGWTIRGKIDRIDRHPDGRVRLLDYKTSDKAEPPDRAHWKPLRSQADPAKTVPEAEAEIAGKAGLWRNLQLPLYFHHWCRENPADRARLQCGYIQLPEAVQDVSFALWDTFDAATEQSAVRCAARVLEAIDGGRFWPPLESGVWNRAPWNLWLPGGPQKCVEEAVP